MLRTALVMASGRPVAPVAGTVSVVIVRSGRYRLTLTTPGEANVLFVSSVSATWLSASATAITW